ncbi:MAG: alpha/beta hydrolase [Chloroflexota bacterium]|nr:alpha/beta hydrolase [Chloroflexota bacterium]
MSRFGFVMSVLAMLVVGVFTPLHAQEVELGFFEADCIFPELDGVTCGYLVVPEDRSQPDGNVVELAVAIISPLNPDASPVPVVYLEGGPGGAALLTTDVFLNHPITENHTLILFDQRGTGFSLPSLNCYELETEDASDDPIAACRDRLLDEGVDLQMYNSAASAADIYDLAVALGYDQIDLWGISYGTKLALTVMRDYPEIVRSAVLDSVYAPETDDLQVQTTGFLDAMNQLFVRCAEDSVCSAAYPELENDFYQMLEAFDANPLTVPYRDAELTLDGDTVYNTLFQTLYDTQAIPFLPYGITLLATAETEDDLASGYDVISATEFPVELEGGAEIEAPIADSDEVLSYIDEYGDISDSEGMAYSVDCQEEYPLNDVDAALSLAEAAPAPLNAFFVSSIESQLESCTVWDVDTADAIETERVTSDIPTLLYAGLFDPITPVTSAESAAEGLANGQVLVFPSAGHGITFTDTRSGECAKELMLDFLADPSSPLDTICIDETSRIDFYMG